MAPPGRLLAPSPSGRSRAGPCWDAVSCEPWEARTRTRCRDGRGTGPPGRTDGPVSAPRYSGSGLPEPRHQSTRTRGRGPQSPPVSPSSALGAAAERGGRVQSTRDGELALRGRHRTCGLGAGSGGAAGSVCGWRRGGFLSSLRGCPSAPGQEHGQVGEDRADRAPAEPPGPRGPAKPPRCHRSPRCRWKRAGGWGTLRGRRLRSAGGPASARPPRGTELSGRVHAPLPVCLWVRGTRIPPGPLFCAITLARMPAQRAEPDLSPGLSCLCGPRPRGPWQLGAPQPPQLPPGQPLLLLECLPQRGAHSPSKPLSISLSPPPPFPSLSLSNPFIFFFSLGWWAQRSQMCPTPQPSLSPLPGPPPCPWHLDTQAAPQEVVGAAAAAGSSGTTPRRRCWSCRRPRALQETPEPVTSPGGWPGWEASGLR